MEAQRLRCTAGDIYIYILAALYALQEQAEQHDGVPADLGSRGPFIALQAPFARHLPKAAANTCSTRPGARRAELRKIQIGSKLALRSSCTAAASVAAITTPSCVRKALGLFFLLKAT